MVKSSAVIALDFLAGQEMPAGGTVCAVYGDESFLKREVLIKIRRSICGEGDAEFSIVTFAGREAEWRDVRDALASVSLFGSAQQVVIVEEADPLVTRYRQDLENYVEKPTSGVLVLEVKTWPGNTRLAKAVAKQGLAIECKAPSEGVAKRWLIAWTKREHGVKLQSAAADALWELLPRELGILQQELAKLVPLAGESHSITLELVQEHVGSWRTRTAWEMIDAVADGNARQALQQLDRLLSAGEPPIGLLAQMAGTLRRFAIATQLIEQAETIGRPVGLRTALQQAGFRSFKLAEAERQLRRIGRERAKRLHGWILSADAAMKGHNSSVPRARMELERLIVRLSGNVAPPGSIPLS